MHSSQLHYHVADFGKVKDSSHPINKVTDVAGEACTLGLKLSARRREYGHPLNGDLLDAL